MHDQEHHEMQLVQTHSSGAEEWLCPTCGRRFIMNWPPAYSKIVIEAGDEYAVHSGGKGGLRLGISAVTAADTSIPDDSLFGATQPSELAQDVDGTYSPAADANDQNETLSLPDDLLAPWRNVLGDAEDDKQ
jgi:hypothetical protein